MRKSILLLLMGLLLGVMSVMALPSASLTVPTYCVGSNQKVSCAVTYDTSGQTNVTDAYLFYRNTTSGGWGIAQRSTSFNLTTYTFNLTSTAYQDSATFGLNCTLAVNGTATTANISSTVTTCTSDNTKPVVDVDLAFDIANKFQTVDCKALSSDATAGLQNYSTNLTKPDTTSVSSTPSNGVQDYGIEDLLEPSDAGYTARCLVKDKAGNSNQASKTFSVTSLDGQSRKAERVGLTPTVRVKNLRNVGIIVGSLLVIGIALVMMSKTAKKRRR